MGGKSPVLCMFHRRRLSQRMYTVWWSLSMISRLLILQISHVILSMKKPLFQCVECSQKMRAKDSLNAIRQCTHAQDPKNGCNHRSTPFHRIQPKQPLPMTLVHSFYTNLDHWVVPVHVIVPQHSRINFGDTWHVFHSKRQTSSRRTEWSKSKPG